MLTDLISRYNTIGHQILDLEAELGVPIEPHKETLDRLIEEARARIQVKDAYTREDALGILSTINSILQNNGFEPQEEDPKEYLFHGGLRYKILDCDNTSFIYLSIAEALNLPLAAVNAPNHVFVRVILDGNGFNWETTSAKERGDDYYRSRLNISDESIRNGVYLRDLTRQETMAIAYTGRGIAWAGKGNLDKVIKDCDEAIRLNPNYAEAYNNRGNAWYGKGSLDRAIEDYNEAVRINPNYAKAYHNRGNAWAGKGSLDRAIEDYNEAVRLNPNYANAYHNRGVARHRKHQYAGALLDFARAKLPILR